ncbi:hypothetical protein [Cyclobacterium qasimii]|uniref:Uncharacterized protein n=2 Tax=Cyclobacterium qasimii TaxID=1350429 RepID=S7X0B7_9BACT|nr:hypothetical protein [Cyclobacterium qasimii]EPR69598.1 hypothetical protein ADICYQ_1383 [Cyclobacterium qasimii M12-11B]GEO21434.1 hypothetical protein CQA01_19680 [Cyclobacterium qasimii]
MENTIEIQKEFEVLVSELNKLKNINQITSTNAENAKRTINEIESFILAVNSFRQGVENDYENKKEDADKVIDSLSLAIKTIIKNTEKHSDEFLKLFDGLSNNFVEETSKTHTKLIKQIEEYSEKLSDINAVNRENIEIFTNTAVEKINERELSLNENINRINNAISLNHKSLNEKIIDIENAVKEKTEIIATKQNEINQKTETEINTNREEIKKSKTIQIIIAVITIGLLLGILLK